MRKIEIIRVNNLIQLNEHAKSYIESCLSDFNTWKSNGSTMAGMLEDLLNDETVALDMSSVQPGSDPYEDLEPYLNEARETDIIIIEHNDVGVVLNEKIAAQYIVDWCAEFATHPDVPALCEKLKEKYHI